LDKYIDAAATPWDDFDPQASVSTSTRNVAGVFETRTGGHPSPYQDWGDCLKNTYVRGYQKVK